MSCKDYYDVALDTMWPSTIMNGTQYEYQDLRTLLKPLSTLH